MTPSDFAMSDTRKAEAVKRFLLGQSLRDIATFYGVRTSTMEQTLREALKQLVGLNAKLQADEQLQQHIAALDEESNPE